MNGEQKIDALLGTPSPAGGGDGIDWKAKYEESERKRREYESMMNGRVSKSDAKNKALEAELAKLKEQRSASNLAGAISKEERERTGIPDDYVEAAAAIASKASESAVLEAQKRMQAEREAAAAAENERRASAFVVEVERKYPKFFESIEPGGDKQQAWASFLVNNRDSVVRAFNEFNIEALSYHIDRFFKEVLGVRPPAGGSHGAPAVDPVPSNGGTLSIDLDNPTRIYTAKEYAELEAKCDKLRRMGQWDEYQKMKGKLEDILDEDRVKD